jgi:hypothetical protein
MEGWLVTIKLEMMLKRAVMKALGTTEETHENCQYGLRSGRDFYRTPSECTSEASDEF